MTIKVQAIGLEDLLRSMPRDPAPAPLSDEARIANLKSAFAIWRKPCPFKAGDLVRPAKHSSSWKTTLGICIVLEILAKPVERGDASKGDAIWTSDMRILIVGDQGYIAEHEAPSHDFELVVGAEA